MSLKTNSVKRNAPLGGPRSVASAFASSPALTALCLCLALSAGLKLITAVQGALDSSTELLLRSPAVFDFLYVLASVYLVSQLWRVRSDVRGDNAKKAAMAGLILFGVMLVTVLYIGLFYFSVYSALGSMSEADLAEGGLTSEDRQKLLSMLPLLLFLLGVSAAETVSVLLFRNVLKRVSELFRGKSSGYGAFTACGIAAAFTAGCCVCELILQAVTGASALSMVLSAIPTLTEAGIYAGMAFLCQGAQNTLRGMAQL